MLSEVNASRKRSIYAVEEPAPRKAEGSLAVHVTVTIATFRYLPFISSMTFRAG
jgi:hypothetical protein